MKKINVILCIIILTMVTVITLKLKTHVAYGSDESVSTNTTVSAPVESIKSITLRLYSEVKNDADEKLWSPAMDSVEWFTATFLGEPVEAIQSKIETYVISEDSRNSFIAIAAFKIDQAVKKYLVANNRHTGPAEIETGQYTEELRQAVNLDEAVKTIYDRLIANAKDLTALEKRYYRFRRQNPGLDPPLELFVLVGSIAEVLLKTEGTEIDAFLKALISVETGYQTTKYNFQNALKTGIISSREQLNTRLRAILDKIAENLMLY
ncbi:MAG: hypothetical protein BWY32_03587 [bacterium ADurb.Bin243]|nr:MAG: hypothetical protein BWY32_03587 [bacterium ADurb.Bin243]